MCTTDNMIPRLTYLHLEGDTPRLLSAPPSRTVLCLGNFDGVHLAHLALLREGLRLADDRSRMNDASRSESFPCEIRKEIEADSCGVFCFFRPSADFVMRGAPAHPAGSAHLTTLRDKLSLFREAGIRYVCLCDFQSVRDLSPAAFIALLRESCRCVGVVCGFNFRFGYRASGGPHDLAEAFGPDRVSVLPEMTMEGETVSASRIRSALLAGNAEYAASLLGRPYSLTTTVTGGKRLGRTIGFPTANQYFLPEMLVPAHGVYAALCHTPQGIFPGVANVGIHPTVDADARVNCETHIFGYTGDLYGYRMRTELLCYLRPEQKFSDIDALIAAIRQDARQAADYIRQHTSLAMNTLSPAALNPLP